MGLVKPAGSGLVAATAAGTPGTSASGIVKPTPAAGPVSLAGSDFVTLQAVKRQAVALLYGDAGLGKTTAGLLAAPGPVALINLDGRGEWAVANAQSQGRRVHYLKVRLPVGINRMSDDKAAAAGREAVEKVVKNLELAVLASERGDVRTIVIDTGTEFGEYLTYRYRGNQRGAPKDYGKSKDLMNQQWWGILSDVRASGVHLIILSRARAIWEDNEPTGEFEPRIMDVVRDGVDWAAHIRRRKRMGLGIGVGTGVVPGTTPVGGLVKPVGGLVRKGGKDMVKENEWRITKAGNNGTELGAVYTQDEWGPSGEYAEEFGEVGPFVYTCCRMYPGTSPNDWR